MAPKVCVDGKPVILAKNLPSLRRLVRLRGELEALAECPSPIPASMLDRHIDSLANILDDFFAPDTTLTRRMNPGPAAATMAASLALVLSFATSLFA